MRTLVAVASLWGSAACGSTPGGVDASAGSDTRGLIVVAEEAWPDWTVGAVSAEIQSAPAPFHSEAIAEGACRLLVHDDVGRCEPACFFEYCDDGVCRPYPAPVSAGDIALTGLAADITLRATDVGYRPPSVPAELFDDGDPVGASAAGDGFPAFALQATGVSELDVALDGPAGDELRLSAGSDRTVTWTAGTGGARVRLWLAAPNESHGSPLAAIIECDGPDTGSLVVPREIVDAFPMQGRAEVCVGRECPLSSIMRYTIDTQATEAGDIALIVGHARRFYLIKE